jgi:hypothetical protein
MAYVKYMKMKMSEYGMYQMQFLLKSLFQVFNLTGFFIFIFNLFFLYVILMQLS